MKARYFKHTLDFIRPAGTSRGVLTQKETWFIVLEDEGKYGVGECGLLRGLSVDDTPDYESKLAWACTQLASGNTSIAQSLIAYPSIRFGVEMALLSLQSATPFQLFSSAFSTGATHIPINGLIWMGDFDFMRKQIEQKLNEGWRCIKMKIGAIDFDQELQLLQKIRAEFTAADITLRVDANGAFTSSDALQKLERLSKLELHSIEQPIKAGNWEQMAQLCEQTPLPIALDEELIGIHDQKDQKQLLDTINPHYIIIKPSLLGGFEASQQWISHLDGRTTGWWATSALESNVGLNAIAQWVFTQKFSSFQGLGTGSLYHNNINAPLQVSGGKLTYMPQQKWAFKF